ETRQDRGVLDRSRVILAEVALKPADTFAADDEIGIDQLLKPLLVGDVAADDNSCSRLIAADQLAHLGHLADTDNDAADADHVVAVLADLLGEALQSGKVEQGAGGINIG